MHSNKRSVSVVSKCWYPARIHFTRSDMGISSCVTAPLRMPDHIVLGTWTFPIIELSPSTNTGLVGSNRRALHAMRESNSF